MLALADIWEVVSQEGVVSLVPAQVRGKGLGHKVNSSRELIFLLHVWMHAWLKKKREKKKKKRYPLRTSVVLWPCSLGIVG